MARKKTTPTRGPGGTSRARITQSLRQELERLESMMRHTEPNRADGDEHKAGSDEDLVDGAQVISQREELSRHHDRLAARVRRVKRALQRIERGDYGRCERCGEPIPKRRLEILPDASTCVRCQEDVERFGDQVASLAEE